MPVAVLGNTASPGVVLVSLLLPVHTLGALLKGGATPAWQPATLHARRLVGSAFLPTTLSPSWPQATAPDAGAAPQAGWGGRRAGWGGGSPGAAPVPQQPAAAAGGRQRDGGHLPGRLGRQEGSHAAVRVHSCCGCPGRRAASAKRSRALRLVLGRAGPSGLRPWPRRRLAARNGAPSAHPAQKGYPRAPWATAATRPGWSLGRGPRRHSAAREV